MKQLQQLLKIFAIAKNDIWVVIIYSVSIGLLSLIIPIAAQNLVTLVSFGTIVDPLLTLAFAVIILLSSAATFRIFQAIIAENIQQKIFTHIGLTLAKKITKMELSIFSQYRGTELLNRFFEIVQIQKIISNILASGASIMLQAIFGLILLALYHPLLLIFDMFFIILLSLAIWLPRKSALNSALQESNEKYYVAGWLEEIARLPILFKFQDFADFALYRTDDHITNYLKARQSHFINLLIHMVSFNVIQVLASSSLLLLGGLLVIKNQLTLGQLVAAEIIVTSLGSNVSRLARYMESIYDLLASAHKIDFLLTLPTEKDAREKKSGLSAPQGFSAPPSILIDHLSFSSKDKENSKLIAPLSIKSGEQWVILGPCCIRTSLINQLVGLERSTGTIEFDGVSIKDFSLSTLRQKVALLRTVDYFDGTFLENLLMHHEHVTHQTLKNLIHLFGLHETLSILPQGLDSSTLKYQDNLSEFELCKLVFIRALLAEPHLVIIDGMLDKLTKEEINFLMDILINGKWTWTLIITTSELYIANYFKNKLTL